MAMKFKKSFVLFLLLAVIFLMLIINKNKNTSAEACVAKDSASWKQCASRLNNKLTNSIKVADMVMCSGINDCRAVIKVNRPVYIYGELNAGFKRLDTYDYNILEIVNSKSVTVRNLMFDEGIKQPCTPVTDPNCKSSIKISGSRDIKIDNITTFHAKRMGTEIYNSPNVTISNSNFINSYLFAIGINGDGKLGSGGVHIEGNLIKDTQSNGIVIYHVRSSAQYPTIIHDNRLVHNHRLNLYNLCGPSKTEPCPGGQIIIAINSSNVKIEANTVIDGKSDTNPTTLATVGIEIDNSNIHYVNISQNDIHNNMGWAINLNPDPVDVDNILIEKNKLYENGLAPFYDNVDIGNFPPGKIKAESENCFSESCPVPFAAKEFAEPSYPLHQK